MPTPRPISEAMLSTKIERPVKCAVAQSTPRVTVTAIAPPITGTAAAVTVPNTSTMATRASGRAHDSARRRSAAEMRSMSSYTAGSPVRYVVSSVRLIERRTVGNSACTCSMVLPNTSTASAAWPSREISDGSPVEAFVWMARRSGTAFRPPRARRMSAWKRAPRASRPELSNTRTSCEPPP